MSGISTVHVVCRGRSARVEVVGDGPHVVFVGAAAPLMWSRPGARAVAALGYTVTNFDYGSHSTDPEPRSAFDQVRDVVDVMDALEIDDGVVVGLSRGAITAFGVAADHSDRVAGLVLVFPVAGFADTIDVQPPEFEPDPGEDEESIMRRSLATVFTQGFLASNLDDAIALASSPPGEVVRLERELEEPFPEGLAVECPTLVIEAGADQVVTPEHPARYLQAVPEAEHFVVPGASHGWLMERPEEFAGVVSGFLSSLRGGPRQIG